MNSSRRTPRPITATGVFPANGELFAGNTPVAVIGRGVRREEFMSPSPTSTSEFVLRLSAGERELLSNLLEERLRARSIEVHRTDALDYREIVQRQENLI